MQEQRAAHEQRERQLALEHVEEARRALGVALEAAEQTARLLHAHRGHRLNAGLRAFVGASRANAIEYGERGLRV